MAILDENELILYRTFKIEYSLIRRLLDDRTYRKVIKSEGSQPIPSTFCLETATSLDMLADVLTWFGKLQPPSIPKSVWLRCQLALAEGFTNAVRHAHKGLAADVPIEIEVSLSNNSIKICIFDRGQPFDLETKLLEMSSKTHHGSPGGRGLMLMRDIADEFSYRRSDPHRNCLAIIKYF
ncbi:MAG: ATP-binding protein [Arthrospira sp. SH-MAG29]|nr:anti-sigma regulatory factor [Arthrospira sp. SH-MAG29]MBS0018170.1 ATP-binding protein [Arthrospira sp. SH-MAG29]